ncbi:ABC transporter permease [Ruminococcaceae bacterium OttesenSCG-928-N02]|nr:ABC transporter permease [Ruminococcaceae bacterium OttesenSCG-928-N02]
MKIADLLKMCADNLLRRKGRSVLTVIGVVVGTCSIVVMMSFGIAINKQYEEMFENMGDLTIIEVYNWNSGNAEVPKLDDNQLAQIAALEGVQAVTPIYQSQHLSFMMYAGKNDRYYAYMWEAIGIYPEAAAAFGFELQDGEGSLNIAQNGSGSGVPKDIPVLFGQYTAYQFMDKRNKDKMVEYYMPDENGEIPPPYFDPLRETITLRTNDSGQDAKNISVVLDVQSVVLQNNRIYQTYSGIIMDIATLRALEEEYFRLNDIRLTNKEKEVNYSQVYVKTNTIDDVDAVEEYLQDLGYSTWSMSSMREEMQSSTRMISMILGALGAISMFVAALSIANTMTMAIYERTKEIGVMKVLGCKISNIRTMFLVESGMIGFTGGAIGLILSYLLSAGINAMSAGMGGGSSASVIPIWLALLGLGFATLVGLVSGFAPANRAVKISALEAIRHE